MLLCDKISTNFEHQQLKTRPFKYNKFVLFYRNSPALVKGPAGILLRKFWHILGQGVATISKA